MPRNKSFRKMKIKKRKQPGGAAKVEKSAALQITELLTQAEADINTFNYDSAVMNCSKILAIEPNHVPAMELLASVCLEMQDVEQAKSLYQQCVELCPDKGFEKYLSLGQLSEGKTALSFYEKGVSIIEQMLEEGQDNVCQAASEKDSSSPSLNRVLSDALCSVAELFMTDLCDEPDAEVNCENALQKSINVDSSNPEAYQCLASLKVIQNKDEEARTSIQKSISFWLPKAMDEELTMENEHYIPEYDSRIKTGKLLIELELYEEASQVLERLLEENDEVFIVWYLLGWSNYVHGDIYKETAHHYLKKAKEVGEKFGCEDEELLQHVSSLLEELKDYDEEDDCVKNEIVISSSDSEQEMDV